VKRTFAFEVAYASKALFHCTLRRRVHNTARPQSHHLPALPTQPGPRGVHALEMADTTSHTIALSGSAELVAEFFLYGVNTLLFQRGIYPPETFIRVSKYGMTILVSQDNKVKEYLTSVLDQMRLWLSRAQLDRVVVVIASVATSTVLERWSFNVHTNTPQDADRDGGGAPATANAETHSSTGALTKKSQAKIVSEIQALIRQITASITFLPLLDEPCSFDILIYTKRDVETPITWEESGPRTIPNASQVQLRSFSTSVHNVEACVAYATEEQ
jgi:mitotic spindle assembly checkpoint protein MAD2